MTLVGDTRKVQRSGESSSSQDRTADHLLLQAEKFKARVEAPKGNYQKFSDMLLPYDYDELRAKFVRPEGLAPLNREILLLRNFDQDDEFFHVTSQIDPSLKTKIEKGEFIELEKLLPKDRSMGRNDELNKQLYQLITQGTSSYLDPPVPKNGKISNIRKWDQAFRVYAAIYTNANPGRASEIWQYIYVIHTAAAANPWDNVYFYDINFRELMASKPWRSWGKTYTQGWNMAFNNNNNATYHGSNSGNNHSGVAFNNNRGSSGSKTWKDDCCWRYNKNRCNKTGSDCRYDHRCTYCAGWNHGAHNCRKKMNMQKRSGSFPGNSANSHNSPKGDKDHK